jgi:hypothetical protein
MRQKPRRRSGAPLLIDHKCNSTSCANARRRYPRDRLFHSPRTAAPNPRHRSREPWSGFVYLIAAGAGDVFELKAYLFDESSGFSPLILASDD